MTESIFKIYRTLRVKYDKAENTEQVRKEIKEDLLSELGSSYRVQCDSTNNRLSAVEQNRIIARIMYHKNATTGRYKYVDLGFGEGWSGVAFQGIK